MISIGGNFFGSSLQPGVRVSRGRSGWSVCFGCRCSCFRSRWERRAGKCRCKAIFVESQWRRILASQHLSVQGNAGIWVTGRIVDNTVLGGRMRPGRTWKTCVRLVLGCSSSKPSSDDSCGDQAGQDGDDPNYENEDESHGCTGMHFINRKNTFLMTDIVRALMIGFKMSPVTQGII
jgi:hypothetical protein